MTELLPPPTPSDLLDTDVVVEGDHLAGRRIALVVSGGIAAMKAPFVARALRAQSARVTAVATRNALRFVTRDALEWCTGQPAVTELTAAAEHLSDREPFDGYLVAPATYNLINKLATGIADGAALTMLAAALRRVSEGRAALLIAATMNGSLHNPLLSRSVSVLAELGVRFVPPRDEYGKHNLPDRGVLVAEVCRSLSRSPLRGRRVLVTGGPTPVPIDGVRRITNRFRGRLAIAIARELHLRGADVTLILGDGALPAPAELAVRTARTFDDYRNEVFAELGRGQDAAVFAAAVADYAPAGAHSGKIPSGRPVLGLELRPTPKVIDEVRTKHPGLYMVTFKFQPGVGEAELHGIARRRLDRFDAVVANRDVDMTTAGEHRAWLVDRAGSTALDGKIGIAAGIADHLERSRVCGGGRG